MSVWLVEKRQVGQLVWEVDLTITPREKECDLPKALFERKPYSRYEFRPAEFMRRPVKPEACRYCDEGNPRVRSSVSERFVHTDTPIGRVVCPRDSSI